MGDANEDSEEPTKYQEAVGLTEKSANTKEVDVIDAALTRLGCRFNALILTLMSLAMLFPGMVTLAPNFVAARPPFNCSDFGELDDSCEWTTEACVAVGNCSDNLERRRTCQRYEFDSSIFTETSVTAFGLVCDRSPLAVLATTLYFVGFLIGSSAYGRVSDAYGRRWTMVAAAANVSVCTAAVAVAPNLWLHWAAQVLSGAGSGGVLTVMYTYALECATTRRRHVWGFTLHHGFAGGILLGTLVAYFERQYQRLLLWYSAAALLLVPPLLPLPESPRWLSSVGRFKEAEAALQRIARIDGTRLKVAVGLVNSDVDKSKAASAVDLLRTRGIRRLTLSVWIVFFGASLAYFGISLGVGNLGGSVFVNQMYSASVELPARLVCALLGARVGRRPGLTVSFGAAGACLLGTGLLFHLQQLPGLRVALAMTGKFWITVAFDTAWLYGAEAFPTVVRSVGLGTSSTSARAGALLTTLIVELTSVWRPLPYLIFAASAFVVMATAITLPETKGRQLADSIEEGEAFVLTGGKRVERQILEIQLNE